MNEEPSKYWTDEKDCQHHNICVLTIGIYVIRRTSLGNQDKRLDSRILLGTVSRETSLTLRNRIYRQKYQRYILSSKTWPTAFLENLSLQLKSSVFVVKRWSFDDELPVDPYTTNLGEIDGNYENNYAHLVTSITTLFTFYYDDD